MFSLVARRFVSEVKKQKPEYLYGVNPVLAALSADRRKMTTLYLNISEKAENKESTAKIAQIKRMSNAKKIKTKFVTKHALQKFTNGKPTQNVVLKVDKMFYNDIRSINDVFSPEEN